MKVNDSTVFMALVLVATVMSAPGQSLHPLFWPLLALAYACSEAVRELRRLSLHQGIDDQDWDDDPLWGDDDDDIDEGGSKDEQPLEGPPSALSFFELVTGTRRN